MCMPCILLKVSIVIKINGMDDSLQADIDMYIHKVADSKRFTVLE